MLFSARRDKPDTEPLILYGAEISFCGSGKYLSVDVDNRLRFEHHEYCDQNKSNDVYCTEFSLRTTKPLACMIFLSLVL